MTEKQRRHIIEVMPLLLVGIVLAAFIVMSIVDASGENTQLRRLDAGWRLNGQAVDALPWRDEQPPGTASSISVVLGEDFASAQTLCFYSVYQDVRVCLDGQEIYRLEKGGRGITKAAPNYWNQVNLPSGSAGAELEIVLTSPYRNYANRIPEVLYDDDAAVTRHVMLQMVPRFAASLAIFIIGLIFSIVAVILRYYSDQDTGLYSFGLFVVVFGIFLTTQYKTLLIWMFDGTSYTFIQQTCFVLLPLLYTRYMIRASKGLKKKIAVTLHTVSLVNAGAVMLLQLLGVCDLLESMSTTRVLCLVIVVYVFMLEIKRQRKIIVGLVALLAGYAFIHFFRTGSITWLVYVALYAYLYQMAFSVISDIVRVEARQIRLEAELEVSRSEIATVQITSHFFYHTLDSIRALIHLDADKAYKMTGDFAKYLRHRVDGVEGMQETTPFSRELRSIRAYTDIKKAQLGERFTMEFDLETEDFEILPLTVQPLVENAVIHAVQLRREGGLVRLVCRELKTGYRIEVIDNGPGPQTRIEVRDAEKRSTAVANVNKRLEFYGIAPLEYEKNALGGMTVRLFTPKQIERKGKKECV